MAALGHRQLLLGPPWPSPTSVWAWEFCTLFWAFSSTISLRCACTTRYHLVGQSLCASDSLDAGPPQPAAVAAHAAFAEHYIITGIQGVCGVQWALAALQSQDEVRRSRCSIELKTAHSHSVHSLHVLVQQNRVHCVAKPRFLWSTVKSGTGTASKAPTPSIPFARLCFGPESRCKAAWRSPSCYHLTEFAGSIRASSSVPRTAFVAALQSCRLLSPASFLVQLHSLSRHTDAFVLLYGGFILEPQSTAPLCAATIGGQSISPSYLLCACGSHHAKNTPFLGLETKLLSPLSPQSCAFLRSILQVIIVLL